MNTLVISIVLLVLLALLLFLWMRKTQAYNRQLETKYLDLLKGCFEGSPAESARLLRAAALVEQGRVDRAEALLDELSGKARGKRSARRCCISRRPVWMPRANPPGAEALSKKPGEQRGLLGRLSEFGGQFKRAGPGSRKAWRPLNAPWSVGPISRAEIGLRPDLNPGAQTEQAAVGAQRPGPGSSGLPRPAGRHGRLLRGHGTERAIRGMDSKGHQGRTK